MPYLTSKAFKFNYVYLARKQVGFLDDFTKDTYDQDLTTYFNEYVSGTGATTKNPDVTTSGSGFINELSTGSTSTGISVLTTDDSSSYTPFCYLGQGETIFEGRLLIPTLSTSGERFKVIIGMVGDIADATINDGVWFEYDEANSANWRYCSSNDGTQSLNNSSTSVSASTWYKIRFVVSPDASSVTYFINDTFVGNIISGSAIPTTSSDPISSMIGIYKSNGTTSRSVRVDYIACDIKLTTER